MSRKMFFCYERSMLGKWEPVVYYDEVPPLNSGGKESAPTRSTVWPVPPTCIKNDGEPSFAMLARKHRAPA